MAFIVNNEKCTKDMLCIDACRLEAIVEGPDGFPVVNPDDCTDCTACANECESGAIGPSDA